LHLVSRFPPHPEPEGDVLEDAQMPEERVVLEDEADVPFADGRAGHVLVRVEDRARVRALQAHDDAEERRLAAARAAEEREQRAARAVEAHVVQGDEGAKGLADPLHRDAHGSTPSICRRWASARSRRVFHSSAVFTKSVTRASIASTEATAKAPGRGIFCKGSPRQTRRG